MTQSGVFLRKASGLVRDWSTFDAFAFQTWSQPFILATYIFSFAAFWPNANMVLGIILLTIMAFVQCLVYTFMVVTLPRAGSDYVWQSRILHPMLGFSIIFPGWLVVLPSWIPLITYGYALQFVSPMLALMGNMQAATWAIGGDAVFIMSILTLIYTFAVCSFGLKWYARVQAALFYLALIGVFAGIAAFAVSDNSTFMSGLNSFYHDKLGYSGSNAYKDIIDAASKQGLSTSLNWDWAAALPLLPLFTFYGIWPTWSSPMYGEVRSVTNVNKIHLSFQMANIPLNILNAVLVLVLWKSVGYEFFQSANYLFWMADATHMPLYPSIGFWIYFATGSVALTMFILFFNLAMGVTLNGAGNGYLIVSRVMFAMGFDQALPSWFADIKTKWRIPLYSFVWVFIIAAIFSWFYSYNVLGFRVIFLDATFVLLLGFMFTSVAAVVLPFRKPDIFKASPASKYMIGGLPLMSLLGIIHIGFALLTFYYWAVDPLYGVNNLLSAQFLASVYAVGAIIFVAFKYYRKSKGVDLNLAYQQVPAE